MSAYIARITTNLRERVHSVNAIAAVSGLNDLQAAFRALDSLVQDGTVIKENVHGCSLYKLNIDQRSFTSHGNLRAVK